MKLQQWKESKTSLQKSPVEGGKSLSKGDNAVPQATTILEIPDATCTHNGGINVFSKV